MAETARKPIRVLVVDDEVKFCRIVAEFLQERGYTVETASTGLDALQAIQRQRPDVALLDMVMPKGPAGLELLELIRQLPNPPRVIMVTASDAEQTAPLALQRGASAYLCKPVNLDALARLIAGEDAGRAAA